MRSKMTRLSGLMRRYQVDRRLPPPVLDLYKRTTSLRAAERTARSAADARAIMGAETVAGSPTSARLGSRRFHTAGDLSMSTFDLGHDFATRVSRLLSAHGVEHFLTDRVGDRLQIGIQISDRTASLTALGELDGDAWFVEWADGSRSGIEPLADALKDRHVRRARSWVVFQTQRWGDRAIGRDQGAQIEFWDLGTSGQLEKVGARGQERFDPRCPFTIEVVDGHEYPGRTAFPVGANFEHVSDPIDIVYTWVDGSDPVWIDAFRSTADVAERNLDETALDPSRYRSRDELKYSLRSIWAYCGWVRTIWIVTAGQHPEWLADDPRVRIVDHADILPAESLPTFNSHAIEAALHHIDGLAEQFIYFNDDMLVARPVRPELFFTPNGLPRVFQSGARPPGVEDEHTLAVDTGARRGRELLVDRFGRAVTSKPYHSPYPLLRSVMADMETEFVEIVERTQHSRFRSPTDLSTAASFAQHYSLATQRGVLGDVSTEYVHVESGRLDWHLDRIRLGDDLDTYCINETNEVAGTHRNREDRIRSFFESVLPIAAPWEK